LINSHAFSLEILQFPVHDVQFSRASGNKILQVQLDVEDLVISDEDVTDNV
jgi:hypothetical protein